MDARVSEETPDFKGYARMKISGANDSQVSCYNRKHYNTRFSSKSLGWIIQLAVRADLAAAAHRGPAQLEYDDPFAPRELLENKGRIENLIRKKHVIDEPALMTIGLSLYCFPTVAELFSDPAAHSVVRQARIGDIKQMLESANNHVERLDERFHEGFRQLNGIDSADGISDYLEELTPTQIKSVAHLSAEDLIDDLLFVVDMNAPTSLLIEKFTQTVEEIKSSEKQQDLTYEWSLYGVLPYIDLSGWDAGHPVVKIDPDVQAELVLPQHRDGRYGPKQLNGKTKTLAQACMDVKGEIFTSLKEAAAREISVAIAVAMDESATQAPVAVAEAWDRWFPHTYPVDIYSMRRLGRAFPTPGTSATQVEEIFRGNGLFSLTTAERIRKFKPDAAAQTGALRKLGAALGF